MSGVRKFPASHALSLLLLATWAYRKQCNDLSQATPYSLPIIMSQRTNPKTPLPIEGTKSAVCIRTIGVCGARRTDVHAAATSAENVSAI